MLMDRPSVATRVGGLVDTVRDGETGILVEPSNPRDLARGIVQMLHSGEQGRAMGRDGRKLMLERFTLRSTAKNLFEVYTRLRSKRRGGYNLLLSFWRMLLAIPVFAYLTGRYLFMELFLPIYFPLYAARFKSIPARIYYRLRHMLALVYYRTRHLACVMLLPVWRVLPRSSRMMIKQSLGRSNSD